MKTLWKVFVVCVGVVVYVGLYSLSRHHMSPVEGVERPLEEGVQHPPVDCGPPSPTIPAFMYEVIEQIVAEDQFKLPDCTHTDIRLNLAYIKTHKCASDTLSAIFRRLALDHNLNVALPVDGHFLLGWPHQMASYMYRPLPAHKHLNVLLDHAVYNRSFMEAIMPPDTVYLTSFREPGDRLTSALTYFAVAKCGHMDKALVESKDRINITREFLANMEHYDTVYTSMENLYSLEQCGCIPNGMSMVRNAMAFDMGFPTGYHVGTQDQQHNYVFIIKWLRQIHQEFPVFILTDHFAECMVLLKRYMCWPMKSILYKKLNDWKNPKVTYPAHQMAAYRNWSNVDSLLYEMLVKVLRRRVGRLGRDFQQETAEYLSQLQRVMSFCTEETTQRIYIARTPWNQVYPVTRQDCDHMQDPKHLRDKLKQLYDEQPPDTYQAVLREARSQRFVWC